MNTPLAITVTPVHVADLHIEGEVMPVNVHVIDHPEGRVLVDTGSSKREAGKSELTERVVVQDLQPELDLALFQIRQLEQRITQQQARVASLKAIGASVDHPEDLLRVLQRSQESLRRFLVRVIPPKKL